MVSGGVCLPWGAQQQPVAWINRAAVSRLSRKEALLVVPPVGLHFGWSQLQSAQHGCWTHCCDGLPACELEDCVLSSSFASCAPSVGLSSGWSQLPMKCDMAAGLTALTVCLVCRGRPKMYAALWGGLADGASPEGVPFGGSGKPILRCVAGHAANLPPDTYLNSLSR